MQRAPHMRRRAAVVAQTLFGLPEVAADDVDELLQLAHPRWDRTSRCRGR